MRHTIKTSKGLIETEPVNGPGNEKVVSVRVVHGGIPFSFTVTMHEAGQIGNAFTLSAEECAADQPRAQA